jgi:hypothetical protein
METVKIRIIVDSEIIFRRELLFMGDSFIFWVNRTGLVKRYEESACG